MQLVLTDAVKGRESVSLPILKDDTIMDIHMRLRNQGWFSSKSCLVIGERPQLAGCRSDH